MLAIVDSGGANIASVRFALERLGVQSELTADPAVIRAAERVILPGVGSASEGMKRLHEMAYALMVDDPPAFMATPFSMPDPAVLVNLADGAGFAQARVETVAKIGEAETALHLATGFVRGNPLWNQLVERRLDADAFEASVAAALAQEFGDSPCRTPMSAHVLIATR